MLLALFVALARKERANALCIDGKRAQGAAEAFAKTAGIIRPLMLLFLHRKPTSGLRRLLLNALLPLRMSREWTRSAFASLWCCFNFWTKLLGGALADLSHSWSIDATELKLDSILGEGTAAKVYKGKYRGQEVAVKVLKESLDPTQMADFQKEFQIYSDLRSPHVVLFFGACLRPELCMVGPFPPCFLSLFLTSIRCSSTVHTERSLTC